MKKIILSVALLATTICELTAQTVPQPRDTYKRNTFWEETVFNGKIKGKFLWQFDFQYRRQADASNSGGNTSNIFKTAFQHVYRPWIHYQMNENVRFSLSPIGFWASWYTAADNKGPRTFQPEIRICPQVTLTNYIGRVRIDQRYRYEFRFLGQKLNNEGLGEFDYTQSGSGDYPMIGPNGALRKQRLRYFVRAIVPFGNHQKLDKKTFYLTVWDELFVGLGKNTPSDRLLDQNRSFALIGYKFNSDFPVRLEVGYGLQAVNKVSSKYDATNTLVTETGNKFEMNNIAQVYLIFENFNMLFKKKEQPKAEEPKLEEKK